MKKLVLVMQTLLLITLNLASLNLASANPDVAVNFHTVPEQPRNFQPFFTKNQPAKVVVEVRDAKGDLLKNVRIKIDIKHVKGFASGIVFNTGFPYLEGKEVLAGEFFSPDGRLEFSYIFPIRGNYRVNVEVLPTDGSPVTFEPVSKEFSVYVKEWDYQIRNAIILVLLILGFGVLLGRVYGRAVG